MILLGDLPDENTVICDETIFSINYFVKKFIENNIDNL